ncbi:hypothetical protein ADK60_20175 [Streptomyces sp. XY431]|uniref:hypothetical protein n=1 Tax=Streptomyces sp. XY431 TaxID=1415562 RepID=UPI0006AF224E|nr:hypothetical protein [Streptomyces sp. XY431]KOV27277.1 hypothetical protein ADK60_20175 [Streptomyces sp. XY431]
MIRRSARTALATAACGAVLAGGLAACGTVQQLNAADKVSKAFETFGSGKSFSAKLSVDATPAQIQAFGAATGEEIDKDSAAALAAVSLSIAFSADKPLKEIRPTKGAGAGNGAATAADPSVSASYTLTGKGGAPLAELRQVGGKSYARGDLAGFAQLVGENAAEVEGLAEGLPTALGNALKGQWVSFDAKALEATGGTGGTGGAGGAATPAPTLDPKAAESLNASLKDILTRDLSFEDKGKQDGKDRITVTAPARKLTDDLLKAVEPLAKDIPNLGKLPKSAPAKVPDRPLALDLYLDGGALSAVTFDLAQLEEKAGPGTPLPLRIAFGHDTPAVQAPAGATELAAEDINGLFGELAAAGGGAGGTDGPAAPLTDAQVKELTRDGAMNEEQVRLYNSLGLGYQDIKDLADLKA